MTFVKDLLILPFATGIAMTLSFLTLRLLKINAKYILWNKIEQKTCSKCIITSGFLPVIIKPKIKKNDNDNNKNNINNNNENNNNNYINDFELTTDIEEYKK